MHSSKRFWRGLFFLLLITALCGGLALPVMNAPARAAPQMQGTACTTITQWDFTGDVVTPSLGTGTFAVGPGLPAPSFAAGDPGRAVTFDTWTSTLDTSKYIDLLVPTSGSNSIVLSFDYRSTNTGPTTLELHYSTNGVDFVLFNSQVLTNDSAFHVLTFDLSAITELDDNPNAAFRLYGYGASGGTGTLRLDDITISDCLTTIELTGTADTNSTNTAAALTGTASAVNATGTSAALTGTPTNTPTNSPTNTNIPSTGSATSVVISEFRTRGTGGGSDEFVEIYNPTINPVDISNWILSASNAEGAVQNRATVPAGTLLRSGQYYLFANNSYVVPSGGVSPNLRYGTSIPNDGGIAILNASGDIIDQVGMDDGSFYQEGTTLPELTGTSNGSYERKDGDDLDSCVDTDNNASDFQDSNSGTVHNYSSPLSLCGSDRPALISSTTQITGDTPDPSNINGNVVVSVRVTGNSLSPSGGRVYITGANTNCTITLNSSGTGSCLVKFTTNGFKTITATYLGDNTHRGSSDTESHQVGSSSVIRTPTRVPTAIPPPPLIVINEFVPRPGHDWNNDGVINVGDEYIELLNHGVVDVNLSGYSLDDEVNIGSAPFRLPSVTLRPGERRVFYGSETGLLLSDGGDGVRLLKPNGQLGDAYNYRVVRFPDQSYCRLPDNGGADDWNQNCFPTPGLQNSLSGSTVNPPTSGDAENLCPIADTLPADFVFAECPPFGDGIWNPAYWDRNGWYGERNLPQSPGKWNVFVD